MTMLNLDGRDSPDDRPGFYYVTIMDHSRHRHGLLAGPFPDDHPAALAMVKRVWRVAVLVNPSDASFAAFGTAWSPVDYGPGVLHDGHTWTATVRRMAATNPLLSDLLARDQLTLEGV